MSSDRALKLNLWGSPDSATFSLAVDHGGGRRLAGLILSKALAETARKAQIPSMPLDAASRILLDGVLVDEPKLAERLDIGTVFKADGEGILLTNMALSADRPEPIVVLVADQAKPGSTSIVQLDDRGVTIGGFTIQVRDPNRATVDV